MTKRAIATDAAPAAVGAYSQGVRAGGFVYTSGQLPITSKGELICDDVERAAAQSLDNVAAVLRAGGAELADVVKVTIFLADMNDFAAVNGVYADFFPEPFPARSCVQVARLPKDAPIEIEAIAHVDA